MKEFEDRLIQLLEPIAQWCRAQIDKSAERQSRDEDWAEHRRMAEELEQNSRQPVVSKIAELLIARVAPESGDEYECVEAIAEKLIPRVWHSYGQSTPPEFDEKAAFAGARQIVEADRWKAVKLGKSLNPVRDRLIEKAKKAGRATKRRKRSES